MKYTLIICLLGLSIFTACSKDDDNPSQPITASNVSSTLQRDSWRITYYYDTDHEETSNFAGFGFTFGLTGDVVATSTLTLVSGSWATATDDSQVKLTFVFTTPAEFAELNEDWRVTERTDSKVKLEHVNSGGAGTDYLTFEKN